MGLLMREAYPNQSLLPPGWGNMLVKPYGRSGQVRSSERVL